MVKDNSVFVQSEFPRLFHFGSGKENGVTVKEDRNVGSVFHNSSMTAEIIY